MSELRRLLPILVVSFMACDDPNAPAVDTRGDACVQAGDAGEIDDAGDVDADASEPMQLPVSCSNGLRDGFESDVDCGGLDCPGCATGLRCTAPSHCASLSCSVGFCLAPTCEDHLANGDESDVDCGGGCDPCPLGDHCAAPEDCASVACSSVGHVCVAPTCDDGVANGTETDEDCGGGCPDECADGSGCKLAGDCASGVCHEQLCATPACDDHVLNGTETDEDCGGSCDPCERHETCGGDGDCVTGHCRVASCVLGPSAGFTVDHASGDAPLAVVTTSVAVPGDAAIASILYDFGNGFSEATSKTFVNPGSYVVRQRVVDANGIADEATVGIEVSTPSFQGVFFSATDKTPAIRVGPTGTTITIEDIGVDGVRSTRSIAPGEGVFYFEASVPEDIRQTTIGLASASASLHERAGQNAQSFGLDTGGQFYYDGNYVGSFDWQNHTYGFVVDYRGTNPIVHVIVDDWGTPAILRTTTLDAVTTPVFIYVAGARQTKEEQVSINPGNDTANAPFHYDPVAVLSSAFPATAAALVRGFGGTRALPLHAAPTVSTPAGVTVALGQPVTLSATAGDAEDGDLTASILWEDLATGIEGTALRHVGGTFTFTPAQIGLHPIRLTVVDAGGKRARTTVDVHVTGSLATFTDVRLVNEPGLTGAGVSLSPEGLRTHYTTDKKDGIRANQGLFGGFWYFEATRLGGVVNQGVGLVIGDVVLDPYPFNTTPPSCSLNTVGGTWRDLMFRATYDTQNTTYGFAVDYRGTYPIAYVVVGGAVIDAIHLVDVTVPVYPMLYGNVTGAAEPYDMAINFGGSAFVYDPVAAMNAFDSSIDTSTFELCWGAENAACP